MVASLMEQPEIMQARSSAYGLLLCWAKERQQRREQFKDHTHIILLESFTEEQEEALNRIFEQVGIQGFTILESEYNRLFAMPL